MSDSFTIDCLPGVPLPAESSSSAPTPGGSPARSTAESESPAVSAFRFSYGDHAYRRSHFELADTDRLNQEHWRFAQEVSVNDSLQERLPIMRARAVYESANNPTVEGLKFQHTIAVHGENGPTIDLQSDTTRGDRWCEDMEGIFEDWSRRADAAGEKSFGDLLKHWNFGCWDDGEFLFQRVDEDRRFRVPGIPHLRFKCIEAQRLITPMDAAADQNIVLGIRRNAHGRPLAYYIDDELHRRYSSGRGRWIPADLVTHGYDSVQARCGQVRGIPWSQWGLPIAADVRDYDLQVLDAARQNADNPIFAYTEHPEAEFADNVPEEIRWRRRTVKFMAPGWKTSQQPPGHPGAHYTDHRQEMHGDLGKAKGVPSMITRLDAREHNYSSARFDYELLGESANHCRATMYAPLTRHVVREVMFETVGMGLIRRPPANVWLELVWPALPQVDEKKASDAETAYLANGTLTYSEACSRNHGRRARDIVRIRARDNRMLEENGLPTVEESVARKAVSDASAANDDSESNDSESVDTGDSKSNAVTSSNA